MSLITFEIAELYRQTFGGRPYVVGEQQPSAELPGFRVEGQKQTLTQASGSQLVADYRGKEIWLPIKFVGLNPSVFGSSEVFLPYATIRLSVKKTIAKTPLPERKGTVKEVYSIEDYKINIKGFVMDEPNKQWPEKELTVLRKLVELNESVQLDNALSNIYLDKDTRVLIENLEIPEVPGGRKYIRPFSFELESDTIFTLEAE